MIDNREYKGYISCEFKFDIPSNDSEIVNNLTTLYNANTISLETLLAQSPYCYDVTQELQRLQEDKYINKVDIDSKTIEG